MGFFTLRLSHDFVVFSRKLVEKKKLSQNGSNNLRVTESRNENAVYANESKSVNERCFQKSLLCSPNEVWEHIVFTLFILRKFY